MNACAWAGTRRASALYSLYCPQDRGSKHVPNALWASRGLRLTPKPQAQLLHYYRASPRTGLQSRKRTKSLSESCSTRTQYATFHSPDGDRALAHVTVPTTQQTTLRRAVPVERYACSGAAAGHKFRRQSVPILEQGAAQVLLLVVPPTPPLGRGQ
jgi:hypothetical protein